MDAGWGRLLRGRTEAFATILVVAALNASSHRIFSALEEGWASALVDLFKISAIIWFAFYAIIRLGLDDKQRQPASPRDLAVLAAIVVACLLPTRAPALLAMLAGATYLFATSPSGSAGRNVAVVTLSLSGPLLFGPVLLNMLGTELLPFDAWLGGSLSGHSVDGNIIQTPQGQVDLMIMPGCSAFTNLTLVAVLAVSLAKLFDVPFGPWLKGGVVLAVIAVILVNGSRLASMAIFPEHFEWLHNGGGATLFGYATLLVSAPIIALAVLRSRPDAA